MNSTHIKSLLILCLFSFNTLAQLPNRSFEKWGPNGPTGWKVNDTLNYNPVTSTGYAHDGNWAANCKTISVDIGQVPEPILAPALIASGSKGNGFPFTGRPKFLTGYFNFTPVGGDKLEVLVTLQRGAGNPIALGRLEISSATGPGYHKFKVPIRYLVKNSVFPTDMVIYISTNAYLGGQNAHVGTEFLLDDISPIEITKPEVNDVIISGEPDTIKWEDGAVSNVDIDYSLDNGKTYKNVVTNYPDSNKYIWDVVPDSLLSRKGRLRIRDHQDTTNNDVQSVIFKPWEFTRFNDNVKGGLEPYKITEDGWSFKNNNPPIWPRSWYNKSAFRYLGGIDPIIKQTYPFQDPWDNSPSSSFPDWPLWVDVFGKSQCYFEGFIDDSYNDHAVADWDANNDSTWNGACFGFSVSSLLGFYWTKNFPETGFFGDNLSSLPFNADSGYTVNYYYTTQFTKKELQYKKGVWKTTAQQLLAQLKRMFRKPNGDGRTLTIYNIQQNSAHSVVAYKLKRNGKTSQFFLRFYNPNLPGNTNQVFLIDSAANSWSDLTAGGWGQNRVYGLFLERESYDYVATPVLPKPAEPLASDSSNSNSNEFIIYNTQKADISISSAAGNELNYKDSTVEDNINNAMPIVPVTGYFHPPTGYYLPQGEYSINLSNFKDSSSYLLIMADSIIYKYRRDDADYNESDQLIYSNGIEILNPDMSSKRIRLQTIINEPNSEKDFDINNIVISQGGSININKMDGEDLLLNNHGAGKNYDLHLRSASADGEKLFFHSQVQLASNSSHKIIPEWNNLADKKVKILVDRGNDGTIDDSMLISNEITEIKDRYSSKIPNTFTLFQNYPNPFNPETTIKYDLPKQAHVTLKVYDILGEEVAELVNGIKKAGSYEVKFAGSRLSSGIYFYSIQTGNKTITKKMILLK